MHTLHTHTYTPSVSSFTIAAGHRLWELNFYPLCPFPPTCVCSLLPASVFAAVSLPFLFSLSPALSQPLFFSLCHFSCAFLCHYSAHVSRLKRRLLLLACVLYACMCVCVCARPCAWVCAQVFVCACFVKCFGSKFNLLFYFKVSNSVCTELRGRWTEKEDSCYMKDCHRL